MHYDMSALDAGSVGPGVIPTTVILLAALAATCWIGSELILSGVEAYHAWRRHRSKKGATRG